MELDPRTFTRKNAEALGLIGCTRASLGVQELDENVQAAINRVQPLSMIQKSLDLLRKNRVTALNFDLMYGLPHQTAAALVNTVEQSVALGPDRIALFGYAHVPWMAKNQRMIPEEALPTPQMRFEQAKEAGDALAALGYERIGLDHFAKPGDSLAIAAREGRLRRNFQGYTDDDAKTLLAFGASSISALPQGYVQNIVETGAYSRAVMAGTLPVAKGIAFSGEDGLRAAIIERLMCDMEVDLAAVAAQFPALAPDFSSELARCADLRGRGPRRTRWHARSREGRGPARAARRLRGVRHLSRRPERRAPSRRRRVAVSVIARRPPAAPRRSRAVCMAPVLLRGFAPRDDERTLSGVLRTGWLGLSYFWLTRPTKISSSELCWVLRSLNRIPASARSFKSVVMPERSLCAS